MGVSGRVFIPFLSPKKSVGERNKKESSGKPRNSLGCTITLGIHFFAP
jgi:hypothetical protein